MIYTPYFFKTALLDAQFKTYQISFDDFFLTKEIKSFCIDSRKIEKDQIYIALPGERVDGHDYLGDVLQKGASGLIIQKNERNRLNNIDSNLLKEKLVITVEDSLHSLKQLAKIWRHRFKIPVVGITGSVGKTTTKQMLASIFNVAKIPAYVSFKNQNTVIGLSLNILKMRAEHKFAAFEMGISHKGEMEELADILRPTVGVITYICNAHIGGLGSLNDIAIEKQKIFKFFRSGNVGIAWGDSSFVKKNSYDFPIITFGLKTKNNIQARMLKTDNDFNTTFNLKLYSKKYPIKVVSNHSGFINNILAASSVANFLEIDPKFIVQGIERYRSFEGRFEKIKIKDDKGILINDSYNASPESMKAALIAFAGLKCRGKKIAVLGDMLELGDQTALLHRQIGRFLSKSLDLDYIILVGKLSSCIAKTLPVILKSKTKRAKDWQRAKELLDNFLLNENSNLILFKASRGIGLDNIVKAFI